MRILMATEKVHTKAEQLRYTWNFNEPVKVPGTK